MHANHKAMEIKPLFSVAYVGARRFGNQICQTVASLIGDWAFADAPTAHAPAAADLGQKTLRYWI
jgi:hypothetical protein